MKKSGRELSVILIAAISILPFITKNLSSIKNQIENLSPALDIYYYQRIFSLDSGLLQLGSMYVDNMSFQYRQTNLISFGEVVQKSLYHLLGERIVTTYFIFSLLLIIVWIFLIQRLIAYDYPLTFVKNVLFTCTLLVILFGNTNVFNANYSFSRIISPQISVLFWLIGLVLVNRIITEKKSISLGYKSLVLFSLLILVASFTYLYIFMSLFGVSIVLMSYLVLQKKYQNLVLFFTFTLVSILPFIVANINKSKVERFQDAGARMGLIKYHFPGSATTLIISLGIIFAIILRKRFATKEIPISKLERILIVSSVGLILASQSNVITGSEIQFYHFNLFAKVNLLIYLLLVASRVKIHRFKVQISGSKKILIVLLSVFLVVNSINRVLLPIISDVRANSSIEILDNRYNYKNRLIVDVSNLQNVFPIYSKAKLLYQSDITTYGFSNTEVLERAYISAGCPSKITESLQSELEVYRAEAIYMKGKALERYLRLFHLDKIFAGAYKPALDTALKERRIVQSEIKNYLILASKKECLRLAKTYGIDNIIFDKKSRWYSITSASNLPITPFTVQGLSLYEYKF